MNGVQLSAAAHGKQDGITLQCILIAFLEDTHIRHRSVKKCKAVQSGELSEQLQAPSMFGDLRVIAVPSQEISELPSV